MMPTLQSLKEMYPNTDEGILRELRTECRDLQSIMERLSHEDRSSVWKTKGAAGNTHPEKKTRTGGKLRPRQPRPDSKPQVKNQPTKPTEQKGALLSRKTKQQEFERGTNTAWSQLTVVDGVIVQPEPEPIPPEPTPQKQEVIYSQTVEVTEVKQPPQENSTQQPKRQPKSKQQQPAEQQPQKQQQSQSQQPEIPQVEHAHAQIPEQPAPIESHQSVQQPQNEEIQQNPKEKTALPPLTLFLPSSLASIHPNYNKFGIFAGPLEKEPEPVQQNEVPTPFQRPIVTISNDSHHFEVPLVKAPQVPLTQSQVFSTQIQAPIHNQPIAQPKEEVQQSEPQYEQVPIQNVQYQPIQQPIQTAIPVQAQGVQPSFVYPPYICPPPGFSAPAEYSTAIPQFNPYIYQMPYQFVFPQQGPAQPVAQQPAAQGQQQIGQNNVQYNTQQQNQRQMPMKQTYSPMQYPPANNNNRRNDNNRGHYQPPIPK